MPFYQASQVQIITGSSTQFIALDSVQSINIGYEAPRSNATYWDSFQPSLRKISEPHKINFSVDFLKSDKIVESGLGLLGVNSILEGLMNSSSLSSGMRTYNVAIKDNMNLFNPSGALLQLKSGVVTNFSINANVGDIVKGNFSIEALEAITVAQIPTATALPTGNAGVVKSQDAKVSMISLTGAGLNEVTLQSFSLSIPLPRTSYLEIGDYFPKKRNLTPPIVASLQFNGYVESFNSITGLRELSERDFISGNIILNLTQESRTSPVTTTYTISNPYLTNLIYSDSAQNYLVVDGSMEIPLDFQNILSSKSNLKIS